MRGDFKGCHLTVVKTLVEFGKVSIDNNNKKLCENTVIVKILCAAIYVGLFDNRGL